MVKRYGGTIFVRLIILQLTQSMVSFRKIQVSLKRVVLCVICICHHINNTLSIWSTVSVCRFLIAPARVTDDNCSKKKRLFLKLKSTNKCIDALNINNVVNHKKFSRVFRQFKLKTTSCISYSYTANIASKLFYYKQVLQSLDINHLLENTVKCSCASSPFIYNPTVYVITGDVSISEYRKHQKVLNIMNPVPLIGVKN